MDTRFLDLLAYVIALTGGLLLPRVALRTCPQCRQLERRTRIRSHRCP